MTLPNLVIGIVIGALLLHSAYELWSHDVADPAWRWWTRLLNLVFLSAVIVIKTRQSRRKD